MHRCKRRKSSRAECPLLNFSTLPLNFEITFDLYYIPLCKLLQLSLPLPTKRLVNYIYPSSLLVHDHVYMFCGDHSSCDFFSVEAFPPHAAAHRSPPPCLTYASGSTSILGQTLYFAGGNDKKQVAGRICQRYSIPRDRWTAIPHMAEERMCCYLVAFHDRWLFAAGGIDSVGAGVRLVEKFDTTDEEAGWESERWMESEVVIRAWPWTMQISDSQIMIIGGVDNPKDEFTFSTETAIFDMAVRRVSRNSDTLRAAGKEFRWNVSSENGRMCTTGSLADAKEGQFYLTEYLLKTRHLLVCNVNDVSKLRQRLLIALH